MPTLNYENAGALVEYDYLQGTITALYPEDDTADVSGVCGSLSKIPIFYHCEPSSVARDNGALTGAAGGFAVGDLVVVLKSSNQASSSLYSLEKIELKGSESTATGPKYFVVGHYDGVVRCTSSDKVLFGQAYNSSDLSGFNSNNSCFFLWDLETDDYAKISYRNEGISTIIPDEDYPISDWRRTYIMNEARKGFSSLEVSVTTSAPGYKLISNSQFDFGAAKVKPGDYVYGKDTSYSWTTVEKVMGCVLKLKDNITYGSKVIVSSSLPVFFTSEYWACNNPSYTIAEGDYLCEVPFYNPETGALLATARFYQNAYGDGTVTGVYHNNISGISEDIDAEAILFAEAYFEDNATSSACGAPVLNGTEWNVASGSPSEMFPDGWGISIDGASITSLYHKYTNLPRKLLRLGNFGGGGYTEFWEITFEEWVVSHDTGSPYYVDPHNYLVSSKTEGGEDGIKNPLAVTQWLQGSSRIGEGSIISYGDLYRSTGEISAGSSKYYCQFYTDYGYTRNTFAQSVKKTSPEMSPNTTRSSKLEEACKKLIRKAGGDTSHVGTRVEYYSGPRDAVYGNNWLAIINGIRGAIPLLEEDSWCMLTIKTVLDDLVASSSLNHNDAESLGFIGGEVLSVDFATSSIGTTFTGWMNSPLHAAVLLGGTWGLAGYAESRYPSSCTDITLGPGMYDAVNGTYTTTTTVLHIPLSVRGQIVCRGMRFTQKF